MKRILVIIVFSIISAFLFYAFLYYSEIDSLDQFASRLFGEEFLLFVFDAICVGICLHLINNWAHKFFIRKRANSTFFFFLFFADLVVAAGFTFGLLSVFYSIFEQVSFIEFIQKDKILLLNFIVILVAFLIVYSVISFFFFSYLKYSVLQLEMTTLKQKQLKLQLKALEQQLSPHFLFNNLNTISSLIYTDIEIAEKYIRKFASVYSKFSSSNANLLVTLRNEITFIDEYVFLLNTRFQNSLNVNINVDDENLEYKILSHSLQLLIENAIKHNSFNEELPLKIEIFVEKSQIIVKNNIQLNKKKIQSHKIGHKNLVHRYKRFTSRKPIFKEFGEYYIASLPLIQNANHE